jgi:hypothetical protein
VEHTDDGLVLDLRLLAEPCLWYREIREGLVESSWADEWVAFASRAEAATPHIAAEPTRRAG